MAGRETEEDLLIELQGCLHKFNEVKRRPDVKELLKDLERNVKLAVPKNRRQRRSMQQAGKHDVTEVYSPPRISEMAGEMGLKKGWALDLTTNDPDDGSP